jgi:hypothetical protein
VTRRRFSRRGALKAFLIGVAAAFLLPYAWGPIYHFPEPIAFAGAHIFNPYASASGNWQRANFHAHGRAWFGLTNGQQSDRDVVERYQRLGYNVPGVSDYQRIAAHHGIATIPGYEHGYNIVKQHQVAIGAHAVEWFDFPLWQSLSHEQYVIDRVRAKADFVALAHPVTRDAYTVDDLRMLTGYDAIEIVNGPFAVPEVWDAALSAGHPVWAVANDDTHDLDDPRRTAAGWNMINAASTAPADIVDALRGGRSYAVQRTGALDAANLTVVDRVHVENATLSISVAGAPSTITFIGQNGTVRKIVKNATHAAYTLSDHDTYVRTVIDAPQTVLYLNPVIRYDGEQPPVGQRATVDVASTWTYRSAIALGSVLALWARIRRRRPVLRPATQPILAGAKRNIA